MSLQPLRTVKLLIIERHLPKFLIVGVIGTAINYLVFYLMYSIWNVHYILACIVGYISGLFLGFYLNKEWTFKRNDYVFSGKSLVLKYICLYGFTLVVAVLVLYLIAEIANVDPLFGYIVSIFCSTALNFYGLKYVVFCAKEFRYTTRIKVRYLVVLVFS